MSKSVSLVFCFLTLVLCTILFQNCSDDPMLLSYSVNSIDFRSKERALLNPPKDADKIGRYVFLVDMSFSMISAPCPQDVDGGSLFSENANYKTVGGWDPNKLLPGRTERDYQRSAAFDCYVDPSKKLSDYPLDFTVAKLVEGNLVQNATVPGSDPRAYRLKAVQAWIDQLRKNLSPQQVDAAKVMIVPFTIGSSLERLLKKLEFSYEFVDLESKSLDNLVEKLKSVHEDTWEKAVDKADFYRWKDRLMGSSNPSKVLDPANEVIFADMVNLSEYSILRKTNYEIITLSDGLFNNPEETINKALGIHNQCSTCDINNPGSCSSICSFIKKSLENEVGFTDTDSDFSVILKLSRMHGMRETFGAGRMQQHFVQINKDFASKVRKEGKNFFQIIAEAYEKYKRQFDYWEADQENLPFALASPFKKKSLQMTHAFVLNLNVRLKTSGELGTDSDGDGLFDDVEEEMGLDPLTARSDGRCLDSIKVNSAYTQKCEALQKFSSCDSKLDTDMDSLNECEESFLGTSPFDFDTDDDGIPDFLEYVYGYNPILSDKDKDSNGDGVFNIEAFAKGLGPSHDIKKYKDFIQYSLNSEALTAVVDGVWEKAFNIEIEQLPYSPKTGAKPFDQTNCELYFTRTYETEKSCSVNGINPSELLYSTNTTKGKNTGLVLLRFKDTANAGEVSWKLKKLYFNKSSGLQGGSQLSDFIDFKVLDEGL